MTTNGSELVFLLEEESARAMLEALLPRLLPAGVGYRCIPFEGKTDLERQMTRRIRDYRNPDARFIVLRDLDRHPDCKAVKAGLLQHCRASGKADRCLVRLACTELETFYLADLAAVEQALDMQEGHLSRHQQKQAYREPDRIDKPSEKLKELTDHRYQKVAGSRAIGARLDLDNPRSPSFRNLISGIRRMAATHTPPA